MRRWAVVLAGGVGTRFWPMSTERRPKQLLPLVSERPLLVEQLERVAPIAAADRTLILTNASLVDAIADVAPDVPRTNIIAEPKPAGTAAALAWAAHIIQQRDGPAATMISVHADSAVGDADAFRAALAEAATAAEAHGVLVTVGIVPTRADPGFGYIEPGESVGDDAHVPRVRRVRRVRRFIEKPTRERAAQLREAGCLWNSGIFAWRVGDFLGQVRAHAREIAPALEQHGGDLAAFFAAVARPVPVDTAVLERSDRVLVVAGDFGWDDVGTWGALRRVRRRDAHGNATIGAVHALDASDNVVHAEPGQQVVLYGVRDLVVVARGGLTVVTTVDASADLKRLVDTLPAGVKDRS